MASWSQPWTRILPRSKILPWTTRFTKFLGIVGSETTFLGVPVQNATSDLSFKLPLEDDVLSRIQVHCGSLGVNSHDPADPKVAWIGIVLTSVMNLAIPAVSMAWTVGTTSSAIWKGLANPFFIIPTAYGIYQILADLVEGSGTTSLDIETVLEALADRLVGVILGAAELETALAAVLAPEEVAEAVPVVGWALKAQAMEGSVVQLAQTIGEVSAAPRVVTFDIKLSMSVQVTLVPEPEFEHGDGPLGIRPDRHELQHHGPI